MDFPFLIYNGKVVSRNDKISLGEIMNRGLYYGDGFFDTQFVVAATRIRNWEFHKNRLLLSFEELGLNPIEELVDAQLYRQLVSDLLIAQGPEIANKDLILRVQCWRLGGRGYMCESTSSAYLIECFESGADKKQVSVTTKTLEASLRSGIPTYLKSSSSYPYVKIANASNNETVVLSSAQGNVLESLNASLFWIKKNQLFAPKETSHLLTGVSRNVLMQLCDEFGYSFQLDSLNLENLVDQDVLFLSNAVHPFSVIGHWDGMKLPNNVIFLELLKHAYLETAKKYSLVIH